MSSKRPDKLVQKGIRKGCNKVVEKTDDVLNDESVGKAKKGLAKAANSAATGITTRLNKWGDFEG